MNDRENGSRCSRKPYDLYNQQDQYSSLRLKVSNFNAMNGRASNWCPRDEEEGVEDEDVGEEDELINGVRIMGNDDDDEDDDDDDDDNEGEEEDDSDDSVKDDDGNNDDQDGGEACNGKGEDIGNGRPQKKRKLRTLLSNYEFARRVPTSLVQKAVLPQPSSAGKNSVGDWTEQETFALLDAWGDLFLRQGRKSLRAEEWHEVAEKVSQQTNIERTDVQCRNRLDTLKKKYKIQKARLVLGGSGIEKGSGKWVFYRKMDMLLSSPPKQQIGLSCGIDSGEYVFTNPTVYLNRANGSDEMRDSPENSESLRNGEDDCSGLPLEGKRNKSRKLDKSSSFNLLANSIEKFSDVYEKIESNKRKQMVELENMRMDFQRQLETQRRQILERAQAEITKIRQGRDYENDFSPENFNG